MHFSFTFFNEPGDQHLPADEFGLPMLHNFSLLVLFGFVGLFIQHMIKLRQRSGERCASGARARVCVCVCVELGV